MPILVDTSVWIDLFRGRRTPQVARLEGLVGREELIIGDLILAEILQGIRDEGDVARVDAAFVAYRVAPLVGEEISRQSAANHRRLRRQGITVRTTVDCLIATWCLVNRVALLHADRDFEPFVRLGLIEA